MKRVASFFLAEEEVAALRIVIDMLDDLLEEVEPDEENELDCD